MITYGTDPEAFFGVRKVLPAGVVFDKVMLSHTYRTEFGNLYVDGAALELQPLPSGNAEEVVDNLRGLLATAVNELAEPTNTRISIVPEMRINLNWCNKDPQLAVFGCDPDRSAWGDSCRPASIDASKHPWRYAGCHLHFGDTNQPTYFLEDDNIVTMSRALDRTVGLASMALGENRDKHRRHTYGRPGVYRVQPWGMEYRTPSNVILQSPDLMRFALSIAGETVKTVQGGHYEAIREVIPDDLVVEILGGDNHQAAKKLYNLMVTAFGFPTCPEAYRGAWKEAWF